MEEEPVAGNGLYGRENDGPQRTRIDVVLIILLAAAVITIGAAAPAGTYAHAQAYQIDSVLDAAGGGSWILPRSHVRGLDRKPPLYVWLTAPAVMLTGWHNDLVFRLPTIMATVATALLVYALGRRWHNRSVGLLAACLWLTALHMGHLTTMILTDMLFTAELTAAILCADRVLFSKRTAGAARWPWPAAFWIMMVLGALTKGWGLVNGALVGGTLLLATGLRNGLRTPRGNVGFEDRMKARAVLVVRRWRRAAGAIHLGWGLVAVGIVLVPLMVVMVIKGGDELRQVFYAEFWQRLSGSGERPPRPTKVPAFLQLLYFQAPTSFFAIGALLMVKPRRWLRGRSPVFLPLCWIAAVVLPFSLAHGFRPDYLLPCYAAMALMGAWSIDRLARLPAAECPRFSSLRHGFAASAALIGLLLVLLSINVLGRPYMPEQLCEMIHVPADVPPLTLAVIAVLPVTGIVIVVLAVRASLSWNVGRLALLVVVGMLGILFMDRHILCPHALTRDGDTMREFAKAIEPVVGDQPYCLCDAEHTTVPLYLSHWGQRVIPPSALPALVNESTTRWLIISDRGLVEAGAAFPNNDGAYRFWANDVHYAFEPNPGELGKVVLKSSRFIQTREAGRLYLIDLARPVRVTGTPVDLERIPGWKAERVDTRD